MKSAVVFGGSGFIGLHFTRYLVDAALFERVILVDLKEPQLHAAYPAVAQAVDEGRVQWIRGDVREAIPLELAGSGVKVTLIANFAAVHREPGHERSEYFDTNLPGAENVCRYAEAVGCDDIIFTSSISPYGPTEEPLDERSTPRPATAYGASKLAAEWIHRCWQAAAPQNTARQLLIVRPGVVFGPGEGGNVSRLIRLVTRGLFVYAGNRSTRKAGIYVKELCHAIWWMHERQRQREAGIDVVNLSMNPGPSVEQFVQAIQSVAGGRRKFPSIPPAMLLGAAWLIEHTVGLFGLLGSVNLVRVRKLVYSNNIVPTRLQEEGYVYKYTLASAFEDWRSDMPREWL
jgi:nucleoside-diphosphate-sugar epimerase